MEMKLYAPKGNVSPLTVSDKPGVFSLETIALNLLRMELMGDEERTAEEAFKALEEMTWQEKIDKTRRWKDDLAGNDRELYEMYQLKNLEKWLNDPLIPAEKAYLELYREEEPELTEEEAKERLWEMLNENNLNLFLEENLPYESPYV